MLNNSAGCKRIQICKFGIAKDRNDNGNYNNSKARYQQFKRQVEDGMI